MPQTTTPVETVDVLIVGAGISGIGAAHYLTTMVPQKSFVILEGRDVAGGTWNLFKYPGIRSDSDLHTFGFEFKPWTDKQSIADASASSTTSTRRSTRTTSATRSATGTRCTRRSGRRRNACGRSTSSAPTPASGSR